MALLAPPIAADEKLAVSNSVATLAPTPSATVPVTVDALPVPDMGNSVVAAAPVGTTPCEEPTVLAALESGDDAAAIAAMGGGEAFRSLVADGNAPCISLSEAGRVWTVVNKQRTFDPIEYSPEPRSLPEGIRSLAGGYLRNDAGAALSAMAAAATDEGVGEIALESGYRSYSTQQSTYNGHVSDMGQAEADKVSARPGHSEHQSGLAADVVACGASGCTSLDGIAGTPQGDWVAENAWRFGYITRYEDGYTDVTGYSPEPWHLRYIGTDLAAAYHDGDWHTLEQFFGLPAAPDYAE